jgi:hypothetical protein
MTIPARSTEQIQKQIVDDIQTNRPDFDLVSGPMYDVVVAPQTNFIKYVEDKIQHASEITTLKYWTAFSFTELDDYASTYGIKRLQGIKSRTILSFVMYTRPISDVFIPAGTIVQLPSSTDSKETENYKFQTTEDIVFRLFEIDRFSTVQGTNRRWVFNVPAESTKVGSFANGIQPRKLTELASNGTFSQYINQVYNMSTTRGGTDIEDNEHFANRMYAVLGYGSVLHPSGLKKYIYDQFPDVVLDITVQKGTKVTRVPSIKQAYDIYVIGEKMKNTTEVFVHDGSRIYKLAMQPVIEIAQATSGTKAYLADVDFQLRKDSIVSYNPGLNNFTQEGAVAGSIKSGDQLTWNYTNGATYPTVGDAITVYYTYNQLIHNIQNKIDTTLDFVAADILVREGINVPIFMGFTVTLKSESITATQVYTDIAEVIMEQINVNRFGDSTTAIDTNLLIDSILKGVSGISSIALDYFNKDKHLVINITNEINLNIKRVNKNVELKWTYGIRQNEIVSTDSVGIYRSIDNGLSYNLIDTISANQRSYYDEAGLTNLVYKLVVNTSTKTFESNEVTTYSSKDKRVETIVLSEIEYAYTDADHINVRFV